MSGFGQINIDPDSHLFVLYMKKNFSFFLKYFAMLVLLEHHVKSKANQLKIIAIYKLYTIKY